MTNETDPANRCNDKARTIGRRKDDAEHEALAVIATKVLDGIELGRQLLAQGGKLDIMSLAVSNVSRWSEKHEGADEQRFRTAHEDAQAQSLVSMQHFERINEKIDGITHKLLWSIVSVIGAIIVVITKTVVNGNVP